MRLGVFTTVFRDRGFEQTLDVLAGLGVEAVEIGTGNWPGDHHCDVKTLLADAKALQRYRAAVEDRGMVISALSQHGNPVHPDGSVAAHDHGVFVDTVRLAAELEVPVVNAFSGCPGSGPDSTRPNWVACAWPPEFGEIRDWQWRERLVPYWQEQVALLHQHGVKVGIELHPGYCVYNTETMLELRRHTDPAIGANYDPSHLFWQGLDPVATIKALGSAIHHVDAKDTFVDAGNVAVNGVIDLKPYTEFADRSWYFRTIGFGQGAQVWRDILSALRVVGYDWVVSIEHEDGLMSPDEGVAKAVEFLLRARAAEPPGEAFWA